MKMFCQPIEKKTRLVTVEPFKIFAQTLANNYTFEVWQEIRKQENYCLLLLNVSLLLNIKFEYIQVYNLILMEFNEPILNVEISTLAFR